QKYSGRLSYADGDLAANSLRSFPHNFEARFDATPTTFHLNQAKLLSGRSQFVLVATVENYSDPTIHARYEAIVEGADLRRILASSSIPTGVVRLAGSARYHAMANRSPLESVVLDGNLSSQQLDVQMPSLHAQINDISVHYELANGDAIVPNLRA